MLKIFQRHTNISMMPRISAKYCSDSSEYSRGVSLTTNMRGDHEDSHERF
jgi:hypothetical protein